MTCLMLLIAALIQSPSPSPAPSPGPSPRQIADLAWIEGHWVGSDGPLQMEEIWTSAAGGALVGLHKDVSTRGGTPRMVSFEFLRIEAGSEGIVYVAQPGGQPPTRFALIEHAGRRVVFANPAHDFPQRILYWLDDAGAPARPRRRPEGRTHGRAGVDVDAANPGQVKRYIVSVDGKRPR